MAVGLWDSSFKNAFHTLSYRFAAVILVILYSRGKGKELKDAEQGRIADTLTTPFGGIFPIMDQFNALLAQTGENGTYPPTRNSSIDSLEASVGLHIAPELVVATSVYFHPFL